MIRSYFKVLNINDHEDSIVVELMPVTNGYAHISNDEDLEKVEIFRNSNSFKVEMNKSLKHQFVVGKVSMVDWFANCPKGWEK